MVWDFSDDFCDICKSPLDECDVCSTALCWNCDVECIQCVWEALDQK